MEQRGEPGVSLDLGGGSTCGHRLTRVSTSFDIVLQVNTRPMHSARLNRLFGPSFTWQSHGINFKRQSAGCKSVVNVLYTRALAAWYDSTGDTVDASCRSKGRDAFIPSCSGGASSPSLRPLYSGRDAQVESPMRDSHAISLPTDGWVQGVRRLDFLVCFGFIFVNGQTAPRWWPSLAGTGME